VVQGCVAAAQAIVGVGEGVSVGDGVAVGGGVSVGTGVTVGVAVGAGAQAPTRIRRSPTVRTVQEQ